MEQIESASMTAEAVGVEGDHNAENSDAGSDYVKEAMLLANSYAELVEQKNRLKAAIDGDWTFTKDMAIQELNSITVSYEGEHVQSSNISRPAERIGILLADGYLQKRHAEHLRERDECILELKYIEWKIGVIESAVKERLDKTQRSVFKQLFLKHRTFKETDNLCYKKTGKRLYNWRIVSMKEQFWLALAGELSIRSTDDDERDYLTMLIKEAEAAEADHDR